jgi:UTP--glucose-1-phosphate uridylyltransferase
MTAVRKAVLPAAGLGTRFLPATKAQPKEMVTLVDKPAIQYVVEEAVRVGLDDVLIVTGRGKHSVEDHFDRSIELERRLESDAKVAELLEVQAVADLAQVHYVRQGEAKGLGHAVSLARQHVGDEPFAVLLPDDLFDERVGVLQGMLEAFERYGQSVVALWRFPSDMITTKGAVAVTPMEDGLYRIHQLVEKPGPGEAPSDLAVVGRYLFTPELFAALEATGPGRGGEIQLTDAINLLLEKEAVYGYPVDWGYYDVGNKLDYLRATVTLALQRPDLAGPFRHFLADAVRPDALGPDALGPDALGPGSGGSDAAQAESSEEAQP